MDTISSAVLMTDTYFGLIAEFFGSIEYARTISLISKYHHEFPQNEQYNLQIISRVLSREFFDLSSMRKLIHIEHASIYDIIYILHHFHSDFTGTKPIQSTRSLQVTPWMTRSFLSRWRYITSFNEVQSYGVKYWLKNMSSSHAHPRHDITEMIFHSNLNGERNTLNVDSCTELMNWSIENIHGDLPAITEFTRLLVGALDLNQNRGHINHSLFAWSLHYLCLYFENKLTDRVHNGNGKYLFCHDVDADNASESMQQDVVIVQELSSLVAELILTLHAANFSVDDNNKMDPFHDALDKYSIARRLKAIWCRVMGEQRLVHFSSQFTVAVSSFFNCLMELSE